MLATFESILPIFLLLARQLGGDAELYAAVTTLQTVVSFFSIPALLALVVQF